VPLVAGQSGVAIDGNGTITISQPGSYYLTKNMTIATANANGIVISSNDVTLDINGFALICTSVDGGSAIVINNFSNIRILNGLIRGATTVSVTTFTALGWKNGIYHSGSSPNISAENFHVQGVRECGVFLGENGSRVERCSVYVAGQLGIFASSISFSTARKCGMTGIDAADGENSAVVTDSFGESLSNVFSGIDAPNGSVQNSRGISIGRYGIFAATAINCQGTSDSWVGIGAVTAMNCIGTSTSGKGMEVTHANNCRGVSSSGVGLAATTASYCTGVSTSGTFGMQISGTASFCQGSRTSGTAISAGIAIGCTSTSGTITSAQKHLGTP
jgi:hypothetical protein